MIRYQYNGQVDPPAPYVHVTIRRADGMGPTTNIPALVDSGADKTVVPQSLIEELSIPQAGLMQAIGLNHVNSVLPLFIVQIGIRDLAPLLVEVIGAQNETYVLLGRDVLNQYRIVLDGPAMLCTIE